MATSSFMRAHKFTEPILCPRSVSHQSSRFALAAARVPVRQLRSATSIGGRQLGAASSTSQGGPCKARKHLFTHASLESEDDASNTLEAPVWDKEKPLPTRNEDLLKYFNDAQQNMLYLNKQRMIALEEFQKAERDRQLLLAKVAQLEAEGQAADAEREVLEQRLRTAESAIAIAESRAGGAIFKIGSKKDVKADPPALWSNLLLRLDAMVVMELIGKPQAAALKELVWKRDIRAAEVFVDLKDADDAALAKGLLALLGQQSRHGIHVVHICTELAPVAQAGSLAQWTLCLSRALRRKGHLVEVIIPKYQSCILDMVEDLREVPRDFFSYFDGNWHQNKIWTGTVYGVPVTFIDPQHPNKWFNRSRLYDYDDDLERFSYFSRAALDYLLKSGKAPDVLHLHNWQTALVPPLFWDHFASQGMSHTRILFTCHDFKYQCIVEPQKLSLSGLDSGQLHRPDRFQDNANPALVNLLKGAIVYSNKVTTLSPIYAHDAQLTHGYGLEPTLTTHQKKFVGILSGLDDSTWDPAKDPFLPALFDASDVAGKDACKEELRRAQNLVEANNATIVGCLAPSVNETELALIRAALVTTLEQGGQFVFLGASRVPRIQVQLEDLALEFENKNVKVNLKFDDSLAHLIVAASDIVVCPGIYDPANQLQLIAYKYGALPVARQLPGTCDSVYDVDDSRRPGAAAAGFPIFAGTPDEMARTVSRAMTKRVNEPEAWQELVRTAMAADFSWDQSANQYIDAYTSILPAGRR